MSTDFRDASARHFEDAELLEAQARPHNADHLFGFSAECSLKAAMVGIGQPVGPDGAPIGYKNHIDALWAKFQSFSSGLLDAKYLAYVPPMNPFASWQAEQRYWGRASFSAPNLTSHRAAAHECRLLVQELILDGVF
ncbi:MAG: SAM-dependent methyltransferase [Candidatus Accumulibacter similis]|nr:MAG: SAM-dependent methyltransferase [Candidatus Accumulibacter similis]